MGFHGLDIRHTSDYGLHMRHSKPPAIDLDHVHNNHAAAVLYLERNLL